MPVYSYITVSLKLYDIVSSANLERAIQAIRTSSSESASPPPQYNEVGTTHSWAWRQFSAARAPWERG